MHISAKIPAEVRGQLSLLLNRYPCGIEQDILLRRYTVSTAENNVFHEVMVLD